jgi:hypothetical protein
VPLELRAVPPDCSSAGARGGLLRAPKPFAMAFLAPPKRFLALAQLVGMFVRSFIPCTFGWAGYTDMEIGDSVTKGLQPRGGGGLGFAAYMGGPKGPSENFYGAGAYTRCVRETDKGERVRSGAGEGPLGAFSLTRSKALGPLISPIINDLQGIVQRAENGLKLSVSLSLCGWKNRAKSRWVQGAPATNAASTVGQRRARIRARGPLQLGCYPQAHRSRMALCVTQSTPSLPRGYRKRYCAQSRLRCAPVRRDLRFRAEQR